MNRGAVAEGLRRYRTIAGEIEFLRASAAEAAGTPEEKSYVQKAEELQAAKLQILRCLNDLPYLERDILWRHFIKGEYWVRIAQEHHYSERQARNIGAAALDDMGKLLDSCPEAAAFFRDFEGADTDI